MIKRLLKRLDVIINLLTAEKENRERVERERMLVEYARSRDKRLPLPMPMKSHELKDERMEGVTDCVPYNLSDIDREVLRMFYTKSDNREK